MIHCVVLCLLVILVNDLILCDYLGEDKFLSVQRQDVRTSKDWVGNKWVDVKGNPNILSNISANIRPSSMLSVPSPIAEAPGSGNTASQEQEVLGDPQVEAVDKDKQELAGLLMTDDLRKMPHHNDEDETINCVDEDDNQDADDNDNDRDSNNKAELVSQDNIESAKWRKSKVAEALKGTV